MHSIKQKILSVITAALLTLGLCPAVALADETTGSDSAEPQTTGVQVQRLYGETAAETSAAISSAGFTSSDWVILARDDDFADAMSATGLAGQLGAPIVLTDRFGLSDSARTEVERLGAKHAYVIGGTGAMPGTFESDLSALGVAAERVFGTSAADTSVACANRIASLKQQAGQSLDKAIVAMSVNFQDALSISSFAYAYGVPIFLQGEGATAADRSLTSEGAAALVNEWAAARVFVPGGTGALSEASVEGVLGTDRVTRMFGETGYDTSAAIADRLTTEGLLSAESVSFACGAEASKGLDALSGAAYAGRDGGIVLLINGNERMESVNDTALEGFFAEVAFGVSKATVLGGEFVVPSAQMTRIQQLLDEADVQVDVDENHKDEVVYKDGVKVLENVSYSVAADGAVSVDAATLPEEVRSGDTIVLAPTEQNPEGAAFVVSSVSKSGDTTVLGGEDADLRDVFETLDIEGATATTAEIIPSDDVEMVLDDSSTQSVTPLLAVDGTSDLGKFTFKLKESPISFKIHPTVDFKVDMDWGNLREVYVALNLEDEIIAKAEAKFDVKLCDVSFATSVPGVYLKLAIWGVAKADGSFTLSVKNEQTLGAHYKAGAFKGIAKAGQPETSVEVTATVKAGFDVTGSVDILAKPLADMSLGAGIKCNLAKTTVHASDFVCVDVGSSIYADFGIGQHDSLLADCGISWSKDLLDEKLANIHLENGVRVDECTWGTENPDPSPNPDQNPDQDPNPEDAPTSDFKYVICSGSEGYGEGEFVSVDGTGFKYYGPGAYVINYTGSQSDVVVPFMLDGANVVSFSYYGNSITSLDVTRATALVQLSCGHSLVSLDVGDNASLKYLYCDNNSSLSSIDVSGCPALEVLSCMNCNLTSLDVRNNTALVDIECGGNNLTSLDVSKNGALESLTCGDNDLSALDVRNNVVLRDLSCSLNSLFTLNISQNTQLATLLCSSNNLTSLDVRSNVNLEWLQCENNSIASLDVCNNVVLQSLGCSNNSLAVLDISCNENLTYLNCDGNYIADTSALEAWLAQSGHYGKVLPQNVQSKAPNEESDFVYEVKEGAGEKNAYVTGYVGDSIDVVVPTTLGGADVVRVNVNECGLASLDVTRCLKLRDLYCSGNNISTLDVSECEALELIYCDRNDLDGLDVSKNTKLMYLDCESNNLTSLDVSKNTVLEGLGCSSNNLTSLDVSHNPKLVYLYCYENKLSSLDVSNHYYLETLECQDNRLVSLNISNDTVLNYLWCHNNCIVDTYDLEKWLSTHGGNHGKVLPQNV